jgi:CPA1 family monovalent cation:H+ antiporter
MADSGTISPAEIFVLLVAASVLIAVVTRRSALLPYSVALVVLGLAVSLLNLPIEVEISPELLLAVLLPGLVFDAAYRTDIRVLGSTAPAVAFLAVPGVLLTAGAVAAALALVTGLDPGLAFLVGTMLAATDPAAVISVMGHVRAPKRLTTLIEAESLFNDGTGIVIFAIALEAIRVEVAPIDMVTGLLVTIAIALVVGTAVGFLAIRALVLVEDRLVELTISLVAAYGSYFLSDRLGQSGLIATVVCGLVFGSYGRRAMNDGSEAAIDVIWEFIGFMATTAVFLLIGLAISFDQLGHAVIPALVAAVALLLARGLMVYVLVGGGSRLAERMAWVKRLPLGWLHLIAWSGLRGAVSVALALSLPTDLPQRDLLQGIVFACVLLTLLVNGTTAGPLVRRLRLPITEPGD